MPGVGTVGAPQAAARALDLSSRCAARTPATPPTPTVAVSRDKYYCIPTFDVQGWPAGQGPPPAAGSDDAGPPAPAKPAVTDFPTNVEPTICAGQCSTTPGCEYFVQTLPAGCYLKSRPFDSDSP
jgi:hypothetical protein